MTLFSRKDALHLIANNFTQWTILDTMTLSAKQAAEQVGMTKQAIINAIKDGRVSAGKNNKGQWQIDPSELFRVFEPVKSLDTLGINNTLQTGRHLTPEIDTSLHLKNKELELELAAARKEIKNLEARNEELQTERNDWKTQAQTLLLKPPQKPVESNKSIFWWRRTRD
jgi:FtsZ-binding cell division protein ZapB